MLHIDAKLSYLLPPWPVQHDKSDGLLAHTRRLKGKEQQTEEAEEYNEL